MSNIKCLYSTIDICCPNCENIIEIDDLDISVTIEGYDICRPVNECAFQIICGECGSSIEINPEMNIGVRLVK